MRCPIRRVAAGLLLLIPATLAGSPPLAACLAGVDWWEQVESSDLIVLAKVERVEPTLLARWLEGGAPLFAGGGRSLWLEALLELVPPSWREPSVGRLVLQPSQSWKGPLPRRLRVGTPWVAHDLEGGELLVFAQRGLWGWTVERMLPRALLRDSGILEDLRRWVEEAVELQRRSPGNREAEIEWLLNGVATPSLRSLAVYEWVAELNPRRSRAGEPLNPTPAQQAVIAAALVADPPRDPSLIPTLHLLEGYDDPQVDQVLVGQIRELLAEECLKPWSVEALRLALDRFASREALRRLAAEDRWPYDGGAIRRIWELGVEEAASHLVPDLGDRLAVDGQIPAAGMPEGGPGDLGPGGA